jgi:hypothetical protein
MAENDTPKVQQDRYEHTPDFVKYYSNNVRFARNAWELTMTFGELAGNLPEGGSRVEQKVAIRMSWPQAKVMAIFLAINVADHETEQGAERIPEFVFGDPLKHLGDKDLTLEEMFTEIIRVFNAQKEAVKK